MPKTTFFPGYDVIEIIHSGTNNLVFRATSQRDSTQAIVKSLQSEYPGLEVIARLKHEYSIATGLDHPNIVKILRLETYDKQLALIFEDFGGISLKKYLETHKFTIEQTLQTAIAISNALVYVHDRQIIHKDIKPANIIINPDTLGVKLTDFSIASQLIKEIPEMSNPDELEGTLLYMSPEQTGRMNLTLDCRTDFYSLGVTLYELLAGQPPFTSKDALELIYSHIAVEPTPIELLNSNISPTLAQIVSKLMAKNAEDRYQSAKSLLADLQHCLQELTTKQTTHFEPVRSDLVSQLLVTEKLYGREQQVQILLDSFKRVTRGKSELILVSGYSGIGKTSVINQVNKPITQANGYFISGKFDRFQRDTSYTSLIQAFSSLIRQLLTESSAQLLVWKERILEAVGTKAQVIIDAIPELELIVGQQPQVATLGVIETQNRFHHVFQQFIRVFARKEQPLVIFLDDLQWADSATLKLIQASIADDSIHYLLLIVAYRDREIHPTHPLLSTLEEIEKAGTPVTKIQLCELSLEDVVELVQDTLCHTSCQIYPLAELIFNKTGGNPFFATQLLQELYQSSLLTFDFDKQSWIWDAGRINAFYINNESAIELIAARIQKLPQTTQDILKIAACIGNQFTLDTLSVVNGKSASETARELNYALQSGLIIPLNQADRTLVEFNQEEANYLSEDLSTVSYKFLHDQVQQAAYSLIPENQKKATHVQIGRMLLEKTPELERESRIFDIVNQLNIGFDTIVKESEKNQLAWLNVIAAEGAKKTTSYQVADRYFNIAISLFNESIWFDDYDFILDLYIQTATSAYSCGKYEQVETLADIVINKAHNILDVIPIYEILINSLFAQNKLVEGMRHGLKVLKVLGWELSEEPTDTEIELVVGKITSLLAQRSIDSLINLPKMKDAKSLAAVRILMSLSTIASILSPKFFLLNTATLVYLSISQGNASFSAFGYSCYGAILCGLGDIESGYQFAELGLDLQTKYNNKVIYSKVLCIASLFVIQRKHHIKESIHLFQQGIEIGLETGDIEFVAWHYYNECFHLFLSGAELTSLAKKIASYSSSINLLKQKIQLDAIKVLQQSVFNLIDCNSISGDLIGESYAVAEYEASENIVSLYFLFLFKLLLSYLFDDRESALKSAIEVKKYLKRSLEHPSINIFYFYYSLTLLAIYDTASPSEQTQILEQCQAHQEKIKHCLQYAPMNFQHKYDLVEAEIARVLNQNTLAADLYDKAIAGAMVNGYTQEEALFNELTAKFYVSLGKTNIARVYITEAYHAYIKWGAIAKVKDLEQRYPSLIIKNQIIAPPMVDVSSTISAIAAKTNSSSSNNQIVDIASVMKASEAIQENTDSDNLPQILLKIILENAGAQKGSLILEKDSELYVEATNNNAILQPILVEDSKEISSKLVRYVVSTQLPLVIRDAMLDPISKNCAYVQQHKCKSILCVPIIYQTQFIGVIYLENNVAVGVFTPQRLELIKILASQAAIAIKNARLYAQEQQKSQALQQRTEELERSQGELAQKAEDLQKALFKLQQTQTQLVHTEKISSLGQLVAGVAHEVNNPVSFIFSNLSHASQYVEDLLDVLKLYQKYLPNPPVEIEEKIEEVYLEHLLEDLPKMISSMKVGTFRIKDIMQSLRNFSRSDGDERKAFDIHEGIETTLMILSHRLKANPKRPAIKIIKEYSSLPKIMCYPGQINQVFMNLIANAIDALEESNASKSYQAIEKNPNKITISTKLSDRSSSCVEICISDNGMGMPEYVRKKLFDAFFTTKPEGKGTGLGLSISYQIITEKHGGTLSCISSPGNGATFVIRIPLS